MDLSNLQQKGNSVIIPPILNYIMSKLLIFISIFGGLHLKAQVVEVYFSSWSVNLYWYSNEPNGRTLNGYANRERIRKNKVSSCRMFGKRKYSPENNEPETLREEIFYDTNGIVLKLIKYARSGEILNVYDRDPVPILLVEDSLKKIYQEGFPQEVPSLNVLPWMTIVPNEVEDSWELIETWVDTATNVTSKYYFTDIISTPYIKFLYDEQGDCFEKFYYDKKEDTMPQFSGFRKRIPVGFESVGIRHSTDSENWSVLIMDKYGNPLEERSEYHSKKRKKPQILTRKVFSYDENFNLLRKYFFHGKNKKPSWEKIFCYDEKGNLILEKYRERNSVVSWTHRYEYSFWD